MTKRKSLTKAVESLNDKTPATTAAVRKAVQATHREEALAHPMADGHTEWLFKVARGEIEAPNAVQSLALKTINELLYGTEVAPTKAGADQVKITISGIGGPSPSDAIDGEVVRETPLSSITVSTGGDDEQS